MNVIVVPGLSSDALGAIIYWRLSGPTDIELLANAFASEGLPKSDLPVENSADTALRLACVEVRQRRRLVRPLEKGGYAIVDEYAAGEKLDHATTLTVRVEPYLQFEPQGHPLSYAIRGAFERHLRELHAAAVSAWLVKRVAAHGGIALRDTGGIYFLPRMATDRWRQLTRATKGATAHTLFEIPALRSDEAIEAVVDALSSEVITDTQELAAKLVDGTMGLRALDRRADECGETLAKVASYEGLVGRKLDGLRARVEALKGEVVAAKLAAELEASD